MQNIRGIELPEATLQSLHVKNLGLSSLTEFLTSYIPAYPIVERVGRLLLEALK
jgi:hypothetical protein